MVILVRLYILQDCVYSKDTGIYMIHILNNVRVFHKLASMLVTFTMKGLRCVDVMKSQIIFSVKKWS